MSWVKTYEAFIYEGGKPDKAVEELEKILDLPTNSGIFTAVTYDKMKRELHIEQPTNLGAMDAGAVLSAINQKKKELAKAYSGARFVVIGDLQIKL